MKEKIENYLSSITQISTFFDLNLDDLKKILKNAHIKNYKNGETLFLKNEKISNFYIILTGSIKLFSNNLDGQEAIIKIANFGDNLSDISSDIFSTNAKAIEDSVVMFFALDKFRKIVKENNILLFNMLLNSSIQIQSLTNQVSQLKLGNSKEKLGEFLLKSSFEKGNKSQNFDLKFDKADIASYLGMRPETLSRTLQKLKDDGEIDINKNQITLPQKHSLCHYCNNEISTKCNSHQSDFCK
jgi:CRP/FNR family transcriptional regulator